jgi:hypothetical protein
MCNICLECDSLFLYRYPNHNLYICGKCWKRFKTHENVFEAWVKAKITKDIIESVNYRRDLRKLEQVQQYGCGLEGQTLESIQAAQNSINTTYLQWADSISQ